MQALPRRHVCRTSCIATARTFVRHLLGNLLAVRRILEDEERRSTPFAHRPLPQPFLQVHPWRSPTALLSAPPAAVSTRSTLVSRARDPPRAHVGLPWLSLVSAHPVLMGAFPSSRRNVSLVTLVYITSCGDVCTPPPHVLPWRTAPGQTTSLCCYPNAILPTR